MKVKILFFIFLSVIYVYVAKDLSLYDKELKSHDYKGSMSNKAKLYSLLGIKKVSSNFLLIKQTTNIGETFGGNKRVQIKENSLVISQINPYLLENYYVSANVLAFIKIYKDYKGAEEILRRGLEYNPKDRYLKNYLAGAIAATKGNDEEVLENYEKIIEKYPDPLMVKVVYNIYYLKVKYNKEFLDKYLYYAEILYENPKYKKEIEKNLKELKIKE